MKIALLALLAAIPLSAGESSHIVLRVESSKGKVESYLPVHLLLERLDGAEVSLPMTDVLRCDSGGKMLVCNGIEYRIAGVTFEVGQ